MSTPAVVTWASIFEDWYQREGMNPAWQHVAMQVKGWPDWRSWRNFSAEQLRLAERTWTIIPVVQPLVTVPQWLVGPYTSWQQRFPQPNVGTFADLAADPIQSAEFRHNPNIAKLQEVFPSATRFIGIQLDDGRIVCVEGHHRATAIALAAADQRAMQIDGATLALGTSLPDDRQILDAALARGTSFQAPSSRR